MNINVTKLQEALTDLEKQRDVLTADLDYAIVSVKSVLARLHKDGLNDANIDGRRKDGPGYVDLAVQYLDSTGKPAHIITLVNHVQTVRKDARRGSIEGALLREVSKGPNARVMKFGKGLYGTRNHAQKALGLSATAGAPN